MELKANFRICHENVGLYRRSNPVSYCQFVVVFCLTTGVCALGQGGAGGGEEAWPAEAAARLGGGAGRRAQAEGQRPLPAEETGS